MSRIAIYEQDAVVYGRLREWLTEAGYVVRDSHLDSDPSAETVLVIASVSAPKAGGIAHIRNLQRVHEGAPIIALTSRARFGPSSEGETAQALGVQRVMGKPLNRYALLMAVRAVIGAPTP